MHGFMERMEQLQSSECLVVAEIQFEWKRRE
jgi:hypothetical protein